MPSATDARKQRENPDNEKNSPSDPNMVGSAATQAVKDTLAGPMSPTCDYDFKAPFAGRK